MRKCGRFPNSRCMARLTGRGEFRKCMIRIGRRLIVGLVARVAFLSCVLENLVLVARNA